MCHVIKPNTYRRCVNFTESQGMVRFEAFATLSYGKGLPICHLNMNLK